MEEETTEDHPLIENSGLDDLKSRIREYYSAQNNLHVPQNILNPIHGLFFAETIVYCSD